MGKYIKTFESFLKDLASQEEKMQKILSSYIDTAFWTEAEKLQDEIEQQSPGTSFDTWIDFLDEDSKSEAYQDIRKFLLLAGDAVDGIDPVILGHDIWLSRNGHGAGFFDRGYPREVTDSLEKAAKELGSVELYLGDDNKLYFS